MTRSLFQGDSCQHVSVCLLAYRTVYLTRCAVTSSWTVSSFSWRTGPGGLPDLISVSCLDYCVKSWSWCDARCKVLWQTRNAPYQWVITSCLDYYVKSWSLCDAHCKVLALPQIITLCLNDCQVLIILQCPSWSICVTDMICNPSLNRHTIPWSLS